MIKSTATQKRQQVISEYISGEGSYKSLGEKYKINPRTIQSWVRAFRKDHPSGKKGKPVDIESLKKQLADARLKNELLEEMLRLSEEHTGIDLRKKYGTRQS